MLCMLSDPIMFGSRLGSSDVAANMFRVGAHVLPANSICVLRSIQMVLQPACMLRHFTIFGDTLGRRKQIALAVGSAVIVCWEWQISDQLR